MHKACFTLTVAAQLLVVAVIRSILRGSIMSGNTFALAEINANDATKAATIGVPSNYRSR